MNREWGWIFGSPPQILVAEGKLATLYFACFPNLLWVCWIFQSWFDSYMGTTGKEKLPLCKQKVTCPFCWMSLFYLGNQMYLLPRNIYLEVLQESFWNEPQCQFQLFNCFVQDILPYVHLGPNSIYSYNYSLFMNCDSEI